MQTVSRHIIYLVMRHDCVIVPKWGAFLSARESAHFDEATGSWTPPMRRITFNPSLTHNDGLLATSIARGSDFTFETASQLIDNTIEEWNRTLLSTGELYMDGIGTFVSNPGASPTFTPKTSDSASNAALFGLPVITTEVIGTSAETETQQPTRRFSPQTLTNHLLRAAASVAIIVAVAATLLTTIGKSHDGLYTASLFNTASSSTEINDCCSDDISDLTSTTSETRELRIALAGSKGEPITVDTTHRYYLIVASLASQDEADRFIASQPKNMRDRLNVLRGESRYRVYVGSASTFSAAYDIRKLEDYTSRYPDAWVYVRSAVRR